MADPTVDLALSVAKPLASKLVEALLKPVIGLGQIVADPLVDIFGDRFSEYLAKQYAKHSFLPTIVFQARKPLEDLYVPLSVTEGDRLNDISTKLKFRLDRYQPEFLPKLERVLLIDDAGMGKTTVSRYLLVQAIKNLSTVPVFVELRHLTPDRTIYDILLSELNPPVRDTPALRIDKRQLVRLLEQAQFTFFLDGYDEIVSKHRESVTIGIKAFVDAYPKNKYLLTSRPEHALASFPSFRIFRIEPLKKEEAFSLIQKYDNNGERSKRLIERLEDPSLRSVHEFLKNPLLTTLLYRAYDYKNHVPLKKPNFYRQVYDALYEWHDLTKDGYATRTKECGLDIDGFHKILRGVGFISMLRGRVEADTDEFLGWIREARAYSPELRFSESDFLEDAIKAVPVLRREGSSILWAHKSLSEYFAAQFVVTDAKQDQDRICRHIWESIELHRFSNFLDLFFDMDVAAFGKQFVAPLLSMYQREAARLRQCFPWLDQAMADNRASATLGILMATYSDAQVNDRRFTELVRQDAVQAAKAWQLDTETINFPPEKLLPEGVAIQFPGALGRSNRRIALRTLHFLHPAYAVLAVLIEKKHPAILLQQFMATKPIGARVVGLRKDRHQLVDSDVKSQWNSPKNFAETSVALMRELRGVINPSKVNATLAEIQSASQQSQMTSAILGSLARS